MNNSYRFTALAGAIALAMGTVGANAATTTATTALPTIAATQLPGHGTVVSGSATAGTISHGAETITVGTNTVIDWGKTGGTLNAAAGSATGFNVGSEAKLTFAQGTNGVLNIDSTGNPSQILGDVISSGGGNIFVANQNGVIVGAGGSITSGGQIGLIGTEAAPAATGFDGTLSTITYNGVGGTVTVAKGASLLGANILIAGGSSVNVDLGALDPGTAVALTAGLKSVNAGGLATNATDSNLSVTGALASGVIAEFESVGDAMVGRGAKVDLRPAGGEIAVAGTLTNLGTLALPSLPSVSGAAPVGALVNSGTATASGTLTVGALTNNAKLSDLGAARLDTTSGGLTNVGQIDGFANINVAGGDFLNQGQIAAPGKGSIRVTNGNLTNSGKISGFDRLETNSNATAPGFTKGADYSLNNNGTITSTSLGGLGLDANLTGSGAASGSGTDSTGSINNQGTLQVAASRLVFLQANNDVTLGGAVQVLNGTKYVATSAAHPLGALEVNAANFGASGFGARTGTATLATDIVEYGWGQFSGLQVAFQGNFSASASGAPSNRVAIYAGPAAGDPTDAANSSYAVRVAAGKTVSAGSIDIYGSSADTPNVILQGTLYGDNVQLGGTGGGNWDGPVSDVFTGPKGGIVLSGAAPTLIINSTGRVKAAPYLNDANFRFNGLPVSVVGSGSTVNLTLNPMPTGNVADMQGTPKAGFNLTVNGNVNLVDTLTTAVAGAPTASGNTAVEGLGQVPNTHLVLQSTGNITTGAAFAGSALTSGDFYWPGYVYLGNINTASGVAAPGTAGLGTITTTGAFNNALAGNTDGADGIHFMTQFPLTLGGDVITNANAWVNFPTQQLVDGYASGVLSPSTHFIGGSNTAGKVITYGPLGSGDFHLQPLNSTP